MEEQNEIPEQELKESPEIEVTQEEIQRHYEHAFHSVDFIKRGNILNLSDDEWARAVQANKDHLKNIMERPYMQGKDFTEFQNVIDNY
jgi:hypothetical protein